jgi:hypothetical protein
VNHAIVAEHFIAGKIGRFADPDFARNCVVIDPAIDRRMFFPECRAEGQRRLLFYARPTIATRNMFELGVIALRLAVMKGVFADQDWRFIGMGEPFAPLSLGGGCTLECAPWLGLEAYAAQMRNSDILLSLMYAPHPSYPPLEMAACGRLVVTNSFGVKSQERLREISPNILAAAPTVEGIVEKLAEAVDRSRAPEFGRSPNAALAAPDDWVASLAPAEAAVIAFWRRHIGHFNLPLDPPQSA